jgi:hypothetical protein
LLSLLICCISIVARDREKELYQYFVRFFPENLAQGWLCYNQITQKDEQDE